MGDPLRASPDADAIFVGKVEGGEFWHPGVVINISTVWKGTVTSRMILTGTHGLCNYQFEIGREYLVYADQDNTGLHASSCSRTMLTSIAQANGEFDRLGAGKPITVSPDSSNWLIYAVLGFGLIALVTLTVVFVRRSQRQRITADNPN